MRSILTRIPSKSQLTRFLSTQATRPEKLNRIADELLSLNPIELHDYTILFRLKMGFKNASISSGLGSSGINQPGAGAGPGAKPAEEKTVFDVKLEKFDASAKIKIIKEVRSFTDLGLKDAKDLVEKTPVVVKKGVTKDEGDSILEKLKLLGATVVLE